MVFEFTKNQTILVTLALVLVLTATPAVAKKKGNKSKKSSESSQQVNKGLDIGTILVESADGKYRVDLKKVENGLKKKYNNKKLRQEGILTKNDKLTLKKLTSYMQKNQSGFRVEGKNHYKLRVMSPVFPTKQKVKWYCNNDHISSDIYPAYVNKTREITKSIDISFNDSSRRNVGHSLRILRCDEKNITVRVFSNTYWTSPGKWDKGGWAQINYFGDPTGAANKLTSIKYNSLPSVPGSRGNKRCMLITQDPVYALNMFPYPAAYPDYIGCELPISEDLNDFYKDMKQTGKKAIKKVIKKLNFFKW